jgi:hypothetical protein
MVQVAQNPEPYFTVSSETPPTWRARFPYLYPPGTGWHWVVPCELTGLCLRPLTELLATRRTRRDRHRTLRRRVLGLAATLPLATLKVSGSFQQRCGRPDGRCRDCNKSAAVAFVVNVLKNQVNISENTLRLLHKDLSVNFA